MLVDALLETLGHLLAFLLEAGVVAGLRQRLELPGHVVQEERHPDAFTLAARANLVHAVVPVARTHPRQPMFAPPAPVPDRPPPMHVHRGGPAGAARGFLI